VQIRGVGPVKLVAQSGSVQEESVPAELALGDLEMQEVQSPKAAWKGRILKSSTRKLSQTLTYL